MSIGNVEAAKGIIVGTPEYHGSFSGVLKNALDLTGSDGFGFLRECETAQRNPCGRKTQAVK